MTLVAAGAVPAGGHADDGVGRGRELGGAGLALPPKLALVAAETIAARLQVKRH
jgi:hypothetical protein